MRYAPCHAQAAGLLSQGEWQREGLRRATGQDCLLNPVALKNYDLFSSCRRALRFVGTTADLAALPAGVLYPLDSMPVVLAGLAQAVWGTQTALYTS